MRANRSQALRAVIAAVVVAFLTFAGSSALTASNTVPTSQAGDGSGTVTGFTITNVSYTLDTTDPSNLDSVDFDTDTAAGEVEVQLESSGDWYECTETGTSVSCDTSSPAMAVADITELRVVAVE
ncbi:MAG: hypothetical protein AAF567_06140 [Actinomycetota bacterium]